MRTMPLVRAAGTATLAGLMLAGSATASFAATPPPEPRGTLATSATSADLATATSPLATTTPYTATCSTGNFRGTANVILTRSGNHIDMTVTRYKIEKLNGQQGGNKANIVFGQVVDDDILFQEGKSPDAMVQDGQWHTLDITAHNNSKDTTAKVNSYVEFTFDKSGADPYCTSWSTVTA